ncbi:uncharacterized protein LOC118434048 [Folsomia candida]|uniref:uncharacterized protein LOC118434048 n=1 Tax=Folsomia candida TaxID=158441 RepID=UPI001604B6A4|nr:uncharacterized protein LOC118434048 [Folsomia candida]XP_035702641.1 uncharacterized protein LOC118434048 [Folsomia candida]
MCLPFDFDEGSNRLVGARSVRQIRMSQFQCVLSTFYCFAMFLLLAIGGLSTTEKFQASPFFMLNLLACIVRWSNVIGNDAIQIINSFLEFEHSTVKAISSNTGTTPVAKAMKYFIALILISLRIISIMQMTLFLFAPCTVPFIVSMSVECRGIRTGLGPSRWIGHILDTWILSHGCYSAAIPVLFVLCVGIVCFLTYFDVLTSYRRSLRLITFTHMASCIRLYRSIHLLEKSFNAFLMQRILPPFMLTCIGLQIMGLYVCIMHQKDIPIAGLLVFHLLGVDAMICSIFTMASLVHTKSTNVLEMLGRTVAGIGKNRKVVRRELKSLTVMNLKFGSNFIDRETPLNIQSFAWNQTVSLCLIKSGQGIT